MNHPNLLGTRIGRLTALFFLYASKGIPYGFTSLAIVNEMSEQGLSKQVIGWYFSSLTWPWAIKWMFGPAVDLFYSKRFGRRRTWLLLTQVVMALTLLIAWRIDFSLHFRIFLAVIFVHNLFAATQGVAMGALACDTVPEEERGLANGLMSAGAYAGTAIGGSGAIFLIDRIGFSANYLLVAGAILAIAAAITANIREKPLPCKETSPTEAAFQVLLREIRAYLREAVKAMLSSRQAFFGIFFALLPPGAFALSLAFTTTFAKQELQMSNDNYAWLSAVSPLVSAVFCIVGGLLSDRFGRRRLMATSVFGVALPTLYLALVLSMHGILAAGQAKTLEANVLSRLILTYWIVSLVYAALQGIGYSVQAAIFMNVTSPLVAATQFTAYTALMNFGRSYYAVAQGYAEEWMSYPAMLIFDSCIGLLCLMPLYWMKAKIPVIPSPRPLETRAASSDSSSP